MTVNLSPPTTTSTLWHTLRVEPALKQLDSDRQFGLTNQQAATQLERYGLNELVESGDVVPGKFWWISSPTSC